LPHCPHSAGQRFICIALPKHDAAASRRRHVLVAPSPRRIRRNHGRQRRAASAVAPDAPTTRPKPPRGVQIALTNPMNPKNLLAAPSPRRLH
jgi:hypothetical protein